MKFLLDLGYSSQECISKERITFQVYDSHSMIFAVWFDKIAGNILVGDCRKARTRKTFINNVKSTNLVHDLRLVHEIVEHYLR